MADKRQPPKYKLNLYLNNQNADINDSIVELGKELGLKRIKQKNALKLLLFNLFYSREEKIAVPRAKTSLAPRRYNPHNVGYSALRTVLDVLSQYGYIEQDIGRRVFSDNLNITTTIQSTLKLLEFFQKNCWHYSESWSYKKAPELVLLRSNTKNKKLIDYTDTAKSNWLREELTQYNELLADSELFLVKEDKKTGEQDIIDFYEDLILARKFIQHNTSQSEIETTYGGRMFAPWCNISSKQRKMITINGERTIELDLEASSINMIYVMQTGKKYPLGDSYELSVNGLKVPRNIVKQATNIMFNTSNIQGAVAALEEHYLPNVFNDNRSKKVIKKAEEYKRIKLTIKPGDIVRGILDKHSVIKDYFLQGKKMGDYISCLESDRVFEIVRRFTKRGIPVLTVYDSFIIQEQYKDELQELMNELPPLNYNNENDDENTHYWGLLSNT